MRHTRALLVLISAAVLAQAREIPRQVPPRRSTQLADGFGMNVALPREPHMGWSTHSWTPIFDSGVKWVRLGQYENSSEKTSWDWVEQTPGRYQVLADVDEAIRSLKDNGVRIEIELQYSNPLYQGDPAARPKRVTLPPPGIGQNDEPVNPIFLPPQTEEQIGAFLKYVRFMVNRYRGTVKHWELWNEPNIGYWRPQTKTKAELAEKGRGYGRVLSRFADVVHKTDPEAKVMLGGLSGPDLVFAEAALGECAGKVDIIAYHTYPGFGTNHAPEEADSMDRASQFRERLVHLPGMRKDVEFWVNEWNVSPKWKQSNESVQARYVPRFYLYTHAQRMRPFLWTFIPSTDGNEGDLYGVIHGDTGGPDAFRPREAMRAFEVTSALFGQTVPDATAEFHAGAPERYSHGELKQFAFRDTQTGKRIYAFWLAVYADPSDRFKAVEIELAVHDPLVSEPVLIDVRTGAVRRLKWTKPGVLRVPLKDSVMAVADASYLDWPELPEAPGELRAAHTGGRISLQWNNYAEGAAVEVERSIDYGPWQRIARLPAGAKNWPDAPAGSGHITYRVRAAGANGPSAWSNPAWVEGR